MRSAQIEPHDRRTHAMNVGYIDIAKQYAPRVGGRYRANGPNSGEQFRDEILLPAYRKSDRLIVRLDGITGYTASFFEEAFGGLVRAENKQGRGAEVLRRVQFDTTDLSFLVPKIKRWMQEALEVGAAAHWRLARLSGRVVVIQAMDVYEAEDEEDVPN